MTDDQARHLPFTLDERTLWQTAMLTLQTDVAALDLLRSIPGVGEYEQVRQAAIELEAFGFRLAVLDLPGLLAGKRAAGRPKDLQILPQIEATLRLRDRPTHGQSPRHRQIVQMANVVRSGTGTAICAQRSTVL